MQEFPPYRQRGLIIHIVSMVVLAAVSVASLVFLFQLQVGVIFMLLVLLFLVTLLPLPLLGYRVYALVHSAYLLDRNSLHLVWGLRREDIPVADVEWVRPRQGLVAPISLPRFSLPGGILGTVRHPDVGDVEFMAAEADTILFVATAQKVYAISPADPTAFVTAFQKAIEMGSLNPGEIHSQYPSFVVARAWESSLVRYLWLLGAFLNVGVFVWVTMLIPGLQRVPLGFTSLQEPQGVVPGLQLILLPILSALLFVVGWSVGLYFYRRDDQRLIALVVWASSALSSLFFVFGVYFLLTTPA